MEYLEIIKKLKKDNYSYADYGMDRIFVKGDMNTFHKNGIYCFTYRDKPNNKIEDIIHLMIK